MHSLQVKFSAVVIALLAIACVSLAFIGTQHERHALETEVRRRGMMAVANLAGAAKDPLLMIEQGGFGGELALELLFDEYDEPEEGISGARLLNHEARVIASAVLAEHDTTGVPRTGSGEADADGPVVERRGSLLEFAEPVIYSGVRIGEAQIEFDLSVLVDPVVRNNRDQLAKAAIALLALGVFAGMIFVALLVGPLKRLRHGVEQMSAGNVMVRVPPTTHDEVGELTRAFN